MESSTRRVAGQHVRAQANAKSWKRFFGGSLKRDYDSWAQGAEGEEVVGQILEALRAEGWFVIHDVSFGRGNIDHILVGPGGIFTIETKSRGGKVWPDHLDPKMLGQAYAEKKTLESITHMEVQALLVFSLPTSLPSRSRAGAGWSSSRRAASSGSSQSSRRRSRVSGPR
jgi:hypothetical protein